VRAVHAPAPATNLDFEFELVGDVFHRTISPQSPKEVVPTYSRQTSVTTAEGTPSGITVSGRTFSSPVSYQSGPSDVLFTSAVAAPSPASVGQPQLPQQQQQLQQPASPTSSWGVAAWTTVPAARKPKKQGMPAPAPAPTVTSSTAEAACKAPIMAQPNVVAAPDYYASDGGFADGDCSELYYELKDCSSARSWQRGMKQTRSVLGQRKISYQVQKRQAQSNGREV